jgi:hypothetical protein
MRSTEREKANERKIDEKNNNKLDKFNLFKEIKITDPKQTC